MIKIEYDPLLKQALEKNPGIEELVFDADSILRAINPSIAKTNPGWCFSITDSCLKKYHEALIRTNDILIKEYCQNQIETTSQIRNILSVKLPLTSL